MRRNTKVVGLEAAKVVMCVHGGKGVPHRCFVRKSMLDKVHIPCWERHISGIVASSPDLVAFLKANLKASFAKIDDQICKEMLEGRQEDSPMEPVPYETIQIKYPKGVF